MRHFVTVLFVAIFSTILLGQPQATGPKVIGFESMPTGKPPEGFTLATTGPGAAGTWVVQEDAKAAEGKNVLVQTSTDDTSMRFPVAVYDGLSAKDVTVSVRFKTVSGKVDQAAGLVARYLDKDNYYVVRANALEDNVRIYKVEKGKRVQFGGTKEKVAPETWHTLKLSVKGTKFQVHLNDKLVFEAEDATFAEAGKVGLWTKADSVTQFDDLRVSP